MTFQQQLEQIKRLLLALKISLLKKNRLTLFCEAIKDREGYFPPGILPDYPSGTPAYRHKNPGNLRYTPLTKELGAIGRSWNNFAIFDSYEAGFIALKTFVRYACENRLKFYKKTMTISQFFEVYAPASDNNDPFSYAAEVAEKCGLSPNDAIANIVN